MDAIFELLHSILPPNAGDAFGTFVSAALTCMIFSYIIGDNLFFRLAQHILIGCVAAYAVVVAVHSVLLSNLLTPLVTDPSAEWTLIVPFVLGVMLLSKASPQTGWFGNISIGFMLGVGSALGVGGALIGTLLPQLRATMISFFDQVRVDMSPAEQLGLIVSNLIIVLGTLGALLSFHFGVERPGTEGSPALGLEAGLRRVRQTLVLTWGGFGRVLIWIAFGALFAGVALSRITLLVERVQFLLDAFHLAVR
jgi:hypothetical protein